MKENKRPVKIHVSSVFIFILTITLFLIAGCSEKRPIKIGLLSSFSGPMASIGESSRNGIMMAVSEANASGGIQGRNIELIIRDDRGQSEIAGLMAGELVDEGADVVIGPYFSFLAEEAMNVFSGEDILVISPTIASPNFVGKDDNLILLNHYSSDHFGAVHAERAFKKYGLRRIAILWDLENNSYTSRWAEGFMTRFTELGGEISAEISEDFSKKLVLTPLIDKALDSDPDCIVFVTSDFQASLLVQLLRKQNPGFPVFLCEAAVTREFITLGGSFADGIETLDLYDPGNQNPAFIRFQDEFRERFSADPDSISLLSYEAARIVLYGMGHQSGNQSVKESIIGKSIFHGLQWDIELNEIGDGMIESRWFIITGGEFVPSDP